jgi:hypothetical protein
VSLLSTITLINFNAANSWHKKYWGTYTDYSLGEKLYENGLYYPLAGNMTIKSGDKFGFYYYRGFGNKDNNINYNVKFKVGLISGSGSVSGSYTLVRDDQKDKSSNLSWSKTMPNVYQFYGIDSGTFKANITSASAVLQIVISTKKASDKSWKNDTFNINVKK